MGMPPGLGSIPVSQYDLFPVGLSKWLTRATVWLPRANLISSWVPAYLNFTTAVSTC